MLVCTRVAVAVKLATPPTHRYANVVGPAGTSESAGNCFFFEFCCFVNYLIHRLQVILLKQDVGLRNKEIAANDTIVKELCCLLRSNARLMSLFKEELD